MPLPILIGVGAAIAGAAGVGAGIHGGVKMKESSDKLKEAQRRNEKNNKRLNAYNDDTLKALDTLGKHEMEILASFKRFSAVFERIKNRPSFKEINKNDSICIPTLQDIEKASVGADVLLGGLGAQHWVQQAVLPQLEEQQLR